MFNECSGLHQVELINDLPRTVNVKRIMIDTWGHPLVLEDVDGTLYNWRHIISIMPIPQLTPKEVQAAYEATIKDYPQPHFPPPPPMNQSKISGRPNPGIVGG